MNPLNPRPYTLNPKQVLFGLTGREPPPPPVTGFDRLTVDFDQVRTPETLILDSNPQPPNAHNLVP